MAFVPSTMIQIEIEGNQFTIDTIRKEVVAAHEKVAQEMIAIAAVPMKTEEEITKQAIKVVQECEGFINTVLGAGTFDKLMEDKEKDLFYIMEMTQYVLEEITKAKEKRPNRYSSH